MTWIWDRDRQTWVEILEKPVEEEHSVSSETPQGSIVQSVESDTATSVVVRPDKSKPARVLRRTLTSMNNTVRILNSKIQLRRFYGYRDIDEDIEEKKIIITTPLMDEEIGESTKLVLRDAEIQANKIISWIEERGRLWADAIIAQAEQKAKEQADSILTDAERKAEELAAGIINKAVLKARGGSKYYIQS
jgi:vacuolar-type H+-ATPase subunit H